MGAAGSSGSGPHREPKSSSWPSPVSLVASASPCTLSSVTYVARSRRSPLFAIFYCTECLKYYNRWSCYNIGYSNLMVEITRWNLIIIALCITISENQVTPKVIIKWIQTRENWSDLGRI
ncbi:hypothetical protein EAG_11167 [Camponotus floridanus]|uniref:Uncharacterized protein n=1 Tax=Camponotus floridanus TaxID=104421 RepID=E2A872_CAMFO|nr:hypothetical protein EAG_11167 [Camponotus floridanus]